MIYSALIKKPCVDRFIRQTSGILYLYTRLGLLSGETQHSGHRGEILALNSVKVTAECKK